METKNNNIIKIDNTKENKLKNRDFLQKLEIMVKRTYYNSQQLLLKISYLTVLALGLLVFCLYIDNITILNIINTKFQFKPLNNLLGMNINFVYIIIYIILLSIFIKVSRIVLKLIIYKQNKTLKLTTYEENNQKMSVIFTPTTKEEVATVIAPECIVSYPNKLEKGVTITEWFANSTDEKDWELKKEKIKNYFGYVKGIRSKESDKMLLYISEKDPLYPEPIYWDNTHLIKSDEFKLVVGKNRFGEDEILNLSTNAHTKIAAGTGRSEKHIFKNVCVYKLYYKENCFLLQI